MRCLVTGGAGFIGSHAVQRLLRDGHEVLAIDDLSRGHAEALDRVREIAPGRLRFEACSIQDADRLRGVVAPFAPEAVLHFAALAYVGESVQIPGRYWAVNVLGMLTLLHACADAERFVFSSSCATYGQPPEDQIPVPETCPQSPVSPYGRTKLVGEWMLRDLVRARALAGKRFGVAMLRYFNVAGADRSGVLGEDHEPETHLIPLAIDAALGRRGALTIFGADYPTPDGTCVRDYVHVEDLVDAHVAALEAIRPGEALAYNVGVGRGYSVREVIETVGEVVGRPVPTLEGERREGDPPRLYADPSKIESELGWRARATDLAEIVRDAASWRRAHPNGYAP
ncbi:MAG: UDP-glucose 4-epimerase GalE [Phycisphaerales bacterium JB059]